MIHRSASCSATATELLYRSIACSTVTEVLFSAIDVVGGRRVCQLADAMLLLECVSCVKELMNSKVGLEYMIQHQDAAGKLVSGESPKHSQSVE